jgi:molecular chaperone GrpE
MPEKQTQADQQEPVKVVDRRWWVQQGATAETAGAQAATDWQPEKPSYVEELQRQLAEKDRQLQEVLGRYREASREFDDARARLRKDVARDAERGRRALLVELLDVLDNLDRAIEAATAAAAPEALVNGVEMVRRLFLSKLESLGVRRLEVRGEAFDPARHEAVATVPAGDAAPGGLVHSVLAPGYTINDEVLRPARVVVTGP